ncbi:unnamed protein product, partial [Onchocerca flexuosa]|uniref:Ovule protein n=1 Tax=Onchocerca flexuosa TaxID=387005 RepID=A0A183I8G2_9BILA
MICFRSMDFVTLQLLYHCSCMMNIPRKMKLYFAHRSFLRLKKGDHMIFPLTIILCN